MLTDIRFLEGGGVGAKLFGHMDIWADDMEDLKVVARDAFEGFCIMVDKHGEGLKKELENMLPK